MENNIFLIFFSSQKKQYIFESKQERYIYIGNVDIGGKTNDRGNLSTYIHIENNPISRLPAITELKSGSMSFSTGGYHLVDIASSIPDVTSYPTYPGYYNLIDLD